MTEPVHESHPTDPDWHARTRAVAAGRPARHTGAPVNPAVTFTSTYIADGPVNYARVGNPTWTALEEAIGALEVGEALTFGSGMAAIAAVVSLVPNGGTVVAATHAYNGTTSLLRERAADGSLEARPVDIADTAEVVAALDGADLLIIESPTNPMMELADIPALTAAAHERGVLVACDNTFATPVLQQPLRDGVDLVVHSVTKYLAGHSDVLLGAVVTPADERGRALRERVLRHRTLAGAIPGPMEAYLALRGLRTLHVRMERAAGNAAVLAGRLGDHPAVERVRYPGSGAMLAIEVRGGPEAAERVSAGVRVWTHSTSLGGVESQIERRRRYELEAVTVPENLLRLSVGIEHVEDLWDDLSRALDAAVDD
ncbi:trans-sulfuration enzyme family protein [Ornithinicoccus hortensis]|uniref:homocysteine desulfhydrase n=1 Tax=Ornithinicoccus hortensis TaxID=82346 RepID=A0A542YM40_9MICO|nr:PLP-dependent transferase [Ornithinicoccus hortensis]TQL49147.1 cystathionine gamma-synthase [Ornithinicoccus hortensis]